MRDLAEAGCRIGVPIGLHVRHSCASAALARLPAFSLSMRIGACSHGLRSHDVGPYRSLFPPTGVLSRSRIVLSVMLHMLCHEIRSLPPMSGTHQTRSRIQEAAVTSRRAGSSMLSALLAALPQYGSTVLPLLALRSIRHPDSVSSTLQKLDRLVRQGCDSAGKVAPLLRQRL